jgi:hypothetical protein
MWSGRYARRGKLLDASGLGDEAEVSWLEQAAVDGEGERLHAHCR